jgi:conjugative transfer signal peptidase TraF
VKPLALVALAVTCAVIAVSSVIVPPRIIWNASHSVPIGLYRVDFQAPGRDDFALVRLPPGLAFLAKRRGYLRGTDYVLKPIAATIGDQVCRIDLAIVVRGTVVAIARRQDGANRPMPVWHGCRRLSAGELLLLSASPDSFDSRYFGPIARPDVIGRAKPIWTISDTVK